MLASRHYHRVNQTVQRMEARAEARASQPAPGHGATVAARFDPGLPNEAEDTLVERPNLLDWDLPPGLASVVQADRARASAPRPAPAERASARDRRPPAEKPRAGGGPLESADMDALLQRLAD